MHATLAEKQTDIFHLLFISSESLFKGYLGTQAHKDTGKHSSKSSKLRNPKRKKDFESFTNPKCFVTCDVLNIIKLNGIQQSVE